MDRKILVVGLTFNEAFGVGITLRNLFSQFQPNQIGIIDYFATPKDFKFSKHIFSICSDEEIMEEIKNIQTNEVNRTRWLEKINSSFFKLVLMLVRKYLVFYYNNYVNYNITLNLKKFIVGFNPDFIYVVPYKGKLVNLALNLNLLYKIPIVTHFMDDFRKRSPSDVFYYLNEYLTRQRMLKIAEKSYKCIAICESMAHEYEKILNKEFYSFHNPINIELFEKHKYHANVKTGHEVKICYTGTIAENNVDTLIEFARSCELLGTSEHDLHFDIYSPVNESNLFYRRFIKSIKDYRHTIFKGSISHNEIIPTLFNYDLLLLPLSFKKKYHSVIEFSFPTKVSEYMACGIPTLYILPPGIALHDYIIKNKIGFLIDQLSSFRIESFLKTFIHDAEMHQEDIRAKEIAYRSFRLTHVASEFEKIFS